jgi:hypothetical protein
MPTPPNLLVGLIRIGGGCSMVTPSPAGFAGSWTANGVNRLLGVAGCGGGVFRGVELADATRSALDLPVLPIPR